MKKIFTFLLVTLIFSAYAQNTSETTLTGTTLPILKVKGFGPSSSPSITQKMSILGYTGTQSTTNETAGIIGYSDNSTIGNYGLIGLAKGDNASKNIGLYAYGGGAISSTNIGILGESDVFSSTGTGVRGKVNSNSNATDLMYGGYFISTPTNGINGSAKSYGLYATSQSVNSGTVATSTGIEAESFAWTTLNSYGVKGTSAGFGTGAEYGGYFLANGISSGNKTGVYATTTGNAIVATRTGVRAVVTGAATTSAYGTYSESNNSDIGNSYGGYFVGSGTGLGSKYGIYSTASGSGTLLAAYLDGKVGIGTSSVSTNEILEVNGRMRIRRGAFASGIWLNNSVNGTDITDGAFVGLNNETSGSETVGFWLNGAFRFFVDRAGNTTIGRNAIIGNNATVTANTTTASLNVSSTATINTINITNSSTFSGSTTFNNTISANDGSFSSNLNIGGQATVNTLSVGGGGTIFKIKKASVTSTLNSFAGNTFTSQNFTVAGAAVGDVVLATPQVSIGSDIMISEVYVSAADTITIKFYKTTAGSTFPQNNFVFNFVVFKI
ncbi:hypothetical protein [Emticicia sp. SJ17W-69]|uniref:hypothetical protein n=1 Tax=Emticicia sp. SJ17W-69 TaxID=3421657 RepID=UPI003EBBC822